MPSKVDTIISAEWLVLAATSISSKENSFDAALSKCQMVIGSKHVLQKVAILIVLDIAKNIFTFKIELCLIINSQHKVGKHGTGFYLWKKKG